MLNYLPIIYFVAGLIFGGVSIVVGFRLGFRASYEIRNHREVTPDGSGLFKTEDEPGEVALADELNKELDGED
jgi:hypothetical protein